MPILPMILVNGAEGIGTGWSTKVPNFNPREIVANLKRLMAGEPPVKMVWLLNLFHAENCSMFSWLIVARRLTNKA